MKQVKRAKLKVHSWAHFSPPAKQRGIQGVFSLSRLFGNIGNSWVKRTTARVLIAVLIFQSILSIILSPQTFALTTGFDFTNSSDYALEDSDKIQVSGGSVSLTWGEETVEDVFSTYLYIGNGTSQTIENGIDLDGNGGMVWVKSRTNVSSSYHALYDTERGAGKMLYSNATNAEGTNANSLTGFNNNWFTVGSSDQSNSSSDDFASWTLREAPGFFDIVTYSGNSVAGREIAHDLGMEPGMVIVKPVSMSAVWSVLHKDARKLRLNETVAQLSVSTTATHFGDDTNIIRPTSSSFTLGSNIETNGSGQNYVAYLFAHDPSEDGKIQCGEYSWSEVNLGWEPQYVLLKAHNTSGHWVVLDSLRGWANGSNDANLYPSSSDAEIGTPVWHPTSTWFYLDWGNYIYCAIRTPQKEPVNSSEVFAAQAIPAGNGGEKVTTGFPVDLSLQRVLRTGNGYSAAYDRLRDGSELRTNTTGVESNTSFEFDHNDGYIQNFSSSDGVSWDFKLAPGFFDVVAYEGTGSYPLSVKHNLGVTPELIIVKRRDATTNWLVGTQFTDTWYPYIFLNRTDGGTDNYPSVFRAKPTSSEFYPGIYGSSGWAYDYNYSGGDYISYLFATIPDVSKVGSYTGTAADLDIDAGFTNGTKFLLIKRTDTSGDWYLWDSERGIVSGNDPYLLLNTSDAEVTSTDYIDPYTSGFQITSSAPAALNASGGEYIYLAIANPNGAVQTSVPTDKPYTITTKDSIQIDTTNWQDVNSALASETLNNSNAWYSVSFDNRSIFKVYDSGNSQWREIVKYNNGTTWMYNSASAGGTNYSACSTNTQEACLSQSMESNTANRMTGTQLNAISDANWEASGGFTTSQTTLDLAVTLFATAGNPTVDSLTLDYEPVSNIAPNNPTLNNYNNGTAGTDSTPTLNFDLSDPDESEEGEEVKYQIQIDNDIDFSSPEVDFTEADFTASPRTAEDYVAQPLADGQWYWRVKAIDDDGLESDWVEATNGFKIDTNLPSSKILYPQDGADLKKVNRIIGQSTDGDGVDFTRISIRNISTGLYYNGTNFSESTETWLTTTPVGADSPKVRWSYNAPAWVDLQSYTIRSRATDMAGNEEHTDAITFTYDTVNGSEGSIYVSNPGIMNNSDYKIFYPNTDPVPTNGYIEIDFDDTFSFSPWIEDGDITLTDQSSGITASTDAFDRANKIITSTITAGSVAGGDMIELEINNLKIHNASSTGSYALPISIYNNFGGLIESGTGMITLVENYQQVEINVNIEQSLQLSVDSGSVLINVDPDQDLGQNWVGTGGVVADKTEVEVKTNAQNGYNLLISLVGNTATGSAVLDGQTLTGSQISSTTGDRVSNENNFTFAAGSGDLATGTAFSITPTQISGVGSSGATNSYIDDIFYYLNVDYETPADTYKGTITYTAVGQF